MMAAFNYKVQLQRADGEIVEKDYAVNWNPAKVDSAEVARSCAAEMTVASGGIETEKGRQYRMPHAGISAVLQK